MSVETEFYTALTGYAPLAALVGTRVYPQQLPPDVTFPAIAYRYIDGVYYAGDREVTRIQIDIYAMTYKGVKQVRDVVRQLADATLNWVYYGGPDIWQDGQELHHQSVDVRIFE